MLVNRNSFLRRGKSDSCASACRPRVPLRHRMPAEKLRKGIYLIPSLFTAGNIMCGFFSIVSTFNGQYIQAALFIIFAHILDGVDGYAARLTKTTSQFGIEFDSLADVVSFGVAPAVLVYFWALVPWGNWGWLAACTYVVCGALRLSRFNVQAGTSAKSHFIGLPIPAAAEMIVATIFLYYYLGGEGAPNKQVTLLLVIYGLAGIDGQRVSLLQLEEHRPKETLSHLDIGFCSDFD